jgi:hypothetical protein
MKNAVRFHILASAVFVALALDGAYAAEVKPVSMAESPLVLTASEAKAVVEFETRLKDYLALQRKLEATLPGVPKKATPEQVNENQQALSALIRTARAGKQSEFFTADAKQGEFFTPDMQALVKRALAAALAGPDGEKSKATITDENTNVANLKVNDRYPDEIPLSAMPLQVLKTLPKLDEGLEYRFIGKRLVLMDTHADMIVDFTENVLP